MPAGTALMTPATIAGALSRLDDAALPAAAAAFRIGQRHRSGCLVVG